MIKHLLFYWYLSKNDFINSFSLLHLHSLNLYKDIFDKKTFIVSMDNPDNDTLLYDYFVKVILNIVPDAEFIKVKNNKEYASEAYWFKTEFIPNLSQYKNEAVFWCHGKGKGGLRYTEERDLYIWISALWHMNMRNKECIDNFIDSDAYMMGVMPYVISPWRFKCPWHYHGGFYWLKAENISEYIQSNNIDLSSALDCDTWEKRYIGEAFPGLIFPTGSTIDGGLASISIGGYYKELPPSSHEKFINEFYSESDKEDFLLNYGQFINR